MQAQGESTIKTKWRRAIEVAIPVAVFAVAAPLAVNSIASAVQQAPSVPASVATVVETVPSTSQSVQQREIAAQIIASVVTVPAENETLATTPAAAEEGTGHSHGGVTPEQALTRAERAELSDELSQGRAAAMRYPTVADAIADGYTMVTGYLPLIGAHYIKFGIMDTTFDIGQPEMLLYDGTEPTSSIVGLSYYLFSDTVPSPFAGPNDVWHQHIGLCLKDGVVVGGEKTSAEECAKRGGAKAAANNGFMVHAWVIAGWDSPQGVFSPEHIGLTADLPTS